VKVEKGREVRGRNENYRAATTSIAAVGTAERYKFLAVKALNARAAVPSFNKDRCFINKFHNDLFLLRSN
jgi:hypothetical protein